MIDFIYPIILTLILTMRVNGSVSFISSFGSDEIPQKGKFITQSLNENEFVVAAEYGSYNFSGPGIKISFTDVNDRGEILEAVKIGGANGNEILGHFEKISNGYLITGATDDKSLTKSDYNIYGAFLWKFGENFDTVWMKTFVKNESASIGGWRAKETNDGGIIMLAWDSFDEILAYGIAMDLMVLKLNCDGEIEWNKAIQYNITTRPVEVIVIEDGYLILAAISLPDVDDRTTLLMKMGLSGEILWTREYKFRDLMVFDPKDMKISSYNDTIIIIADSRRSTGSLDGVVAKLNSTTGEMIFAKLIGGKESENFWRIIESQDGNLVIVGTTRSYGSGYFEFWFTKLDNEGNIITSRTYGSSYSSDVGSDVLEINENEFIMVGNVDENKILLMKLNEQGTGCVFQNSMINNIEISPAVSLINGSDLGFSMVDIIGDIANYSRILIQNDVHADVLVQSIIETYVHEEFCLTECHSIPFNSELACSGADFGACIGSDNCVCNKSNGIYGDRCNEQIFEANFENSDLKRIKVKYFSEKSLFEEYNRPYLENPVFNCSEVLENWNSFLYSESVCRFEFINFQIFSFTERLIIDICDSCDISSKISSNLTLRIKTISKPNEVVERVVFLPEKNENNEDDTTPRNYEIILYVLIGLCLVFSCITAVFIFLLCTGCVFVFAIVFRVFRIRRELKRFSKLENVDLLLEEQKLEKDSTLTSIKINRKIFQIDFSKVKLQKLIGSGGSQSNVYRCEYKGSVFAYKSFTCRYILSDKTSMMNFEREVELLSSLSHKNILEFIGACIKPPRIGILMEYCSKGDLKRFLKNYRTKSEEKYPLSEKLRILLEICQAMIMVHHRDIIHRDLKLENVLIDQNEISKLMDFGLSRFVENHQNVSLTKRIGTSLFMSPELLRGEEYSKPVDVFAFGIMAWIVWTEEYFPYGKENTRIEQQIAFNPHFRPDIRLICNRTLEYLLKSCWCHDHKKRFSFEKILSILKKMEKGISNNIEEGIIIYLKLETEKDNEAEDFCLQELTMKELMNIIDEKWKGKIKIERIFCVREDNNMKIELRDDGDVKNILQNNDLVVIVLDSTGKD